MGNLNKTTIKRLSMLADKLEEELPKGLKFNLSAWSQPWGCGTAACAVGYAASLPAFKELGLRLIAPAGSMFPVPAHGSRRGWCALRSFFKLSLLDCEHLFSALCYKNYNKTRKASVARRIRKFIDDDGVYKEQHAEGFEFL